MAKTSEKPWKPWEITFQRAMDEEDAQASVEFAVLLPVYLMLLIALTYSGHIMIIRQQVVEAARWYAWAPNQAAKSQDPNVFYKRFTIKPTAPRPAVNRSGFQWQKSDFDGLKHKADDKTKEVALALLNAVYSEGGRIQKSTTEATVTYTFPWVLRVGPETLTQRCPHTVYVIEDARKMPREGAVFKEGRTHPIEGFTNSDSAPGNLPRFDPSPRRSDPGNPSSAIEGHYFIQHGRYSGQRGLDGKNHSGHKCMWNTNHKLDQSQQPFYRRGGGF